MCDAPSEPEVMVMVAHAKSGAQPYTQRVELGHHTVIADEPAARGGGDTGPSPTGLLLAALASCTSITLAMYAARKGWELGEVKVDVALYVAGDAQRIERKLRFTAPLTPEQQARLVEIADKTPVTKTLREGVVIATRVL